MRVSLTLFLKERIKELIIEKYSVPKDSITDDLLEEKIEMIKKEHNALGWDKTSEYGGSLDEYLEYPTEDEIEKLRSTVDGFLSKFK